MPIQTTELSHAVRPKIMLTYLKQLLISLTFLATPPLFVSIYFGEYTMAARFTIVICSLLLLNLLLVKVNVKASLQLNESMTLAALIFLIAPLVLSYPMMTTGLSFGDALFECISAITTTGLSIVASTREATPAFLFSRAWMQWFGALAIVVFSLALITQPGIVATIAELQEDDLTGGLREQSKRLFKIYALITVLGILGTIFLRMGFFDAVLFTFSAVSTGGFSPYTDSIGSLGIAPQCWITLLCFVGAMPLPFFYRRFFGIQSIRINTVQIKALIIMACVVTGILALFLRYIDKLSWSHVIHHAPLLALSAQTTAGYSTLDLTILDPSSKLLLSFIMLVGGGLGSTSGGFKLLRFLIACNIFRFILLKTSLSKHAVAEPYLAGRRLEYSEIAEGLLLIIIYLAVVAISWMIFVIMGYDPMNALFEITSATGTVGLSVGVTNAHLPMILKSVLCVDMLLGRLEIFAWIVMLYPKTWVGNRTEII